MKSFTFDVHRYPEEIKVEAESREEAEQKAKDIFYAGNNNASVYNIEMTDEEEITN